MHVRDATPGDADACRAIYEPYVHDGAITFEEESPNVEQMAQRIAAAQERHAWLVLVDRDEVCGYAYGARFAPRPAYRWACEVSVYLGTQHHGKGGGRMLYEALLERLSQRGYHLALGGMTLPNPASAALHRSLGFEESGVYRRVGFKHGAWHDVAWFQRELAPPAPPRGEPGS